MAVMSAEASQRRSIPKDLSSAISELDKCVSEHEQVHNGYYEKIKHVEDSVVAAKDDDTRFRLIQKAGDMCRAYDVDKSIEWYSHGRGEAIAKGNRLAQYRFELLLSWIMPISGVVKEALDMHAAVPVDSLSGDDKVLYYESANKLYCYCESFYTSENIKHKYHTMAEAATDSLLEYMDSSLPSYKIYSAQCYDNDGQRALAKAQLQDLIKQVDINDNLYAMAACSYALLLSDDAEKFTDESLYYLVLAAISDCRSATREATALQLVAKVLYQRGDLERAYNYMMVAMDDAVSSGSRIRTLDVAEIAPIIVGAFTQKDKNTRVRLNIYICIIFAGLISFMVVMWYLVKERNKLNGMKQTLAQRNASKDDYIGQILAICVHYIERLEDFNRLVGRKLKAGQSSDLYNMIESGKTLQEQTQRFHDVFDRAFNKIYPTFVDEVNKLLIPEKRIQLTSPDKLTPELRILAFMRLGIDDAAQLSRLLGLSINTIYTYRNKAKLRALDRENFEQNVLKIGDID
jgi:hypothetical protein